MHASPSRHMTTSMAAGASWRSSRRIKASNARPSSRRTKGTGQRRRQPRNSNVKFPIASTRAPPRCRMQLVRINETPLLLWSRSFQVGLWARASEQRARLYDTTGPGAAASECQVLSASPSPRPWQSVALRSLARPGRPFEGPLPVGRRTPARNGRRPGVHWHWAPLAVAST